MAPLLQKLLHLMLMISAASAWSRQTYYRYYGGSITFTPKGQNPDGTYEVELRNKQATFYCNVNGFRCYYGNCGSTQQSSSAVVDRNTYSLTWCQQEVVMTKKLSGNLPFAIRYPTYYNPTYGRGYWISNVRSSQAGWQLMAHIDLGIRSDTGESNRSPSTAIIPILRVNRNCPRSYSIPMFDADGDRVRCRVARTSHNYECSLCGLTSGFSLDQNNCTLHYVGSHQYNRYHPIELMMEDFPHEHITLSYSDGSYISKLPQSSGRRKRQLLAVGGRSTTTAAPTTTTAAPTTTTTSAPTTTTAAPTTTTTAAPTTTTAAPTTTTAAPTTTTTAAPTTTTAAPTTTTTAAPTTTTAAPTTTTTAAPTTTTAAPTTTTTAAPTTTTVAPTTTTTAAPTTTTAAPTTTTTAAPTTTTAAPTTTTAAPTTTTCSPTTTAAPTTTTVAPTTTTAAPTTTTAAPTTTTASPTTTTAAPTTTTSPTNIRRPFRSSIAPLSKLPVQFSVYVDYTYAPSCVDGDYFPIFLSPTPSNGVNLPAFVNQTLEIKVRSTALYTTIVGLLVTGPKGIYKQRITTEEYIIKWTPTNNELNDHFPICFISEARDRSSGSFYQSELRCVTVDVGHHEATVTCNETTMTVEVEKSYLIRRNEENLHLNSFTGPSCNLTTLSNSSHLVAIMSLDDCGTLIEEDEDNIIFKNDITSADVSQIISRQHDVDIALSCVYPKRTNLTLGFRHKNPYAFSERGFGTFKYQFEFFESQRFQTPKDASTYPLEVSLKQKIFMQIEATTSIPDTELFVESCRATPYDNPNSRTVYTIIDNGCVKDNTVQIYPGSKYQFRFGMEAFEFIGAHEEVYITCSVLLCERGVPGTRCSQGCIRSNSGNHRSKREAEAQTSTHSISQGPLHLLKTSDSRVSGSGLSLGVNLLFIVGCILVVAVVIYRSRGSRAKYQRLPTSETD